MARAFLRQVWALDASTTTMDDAPNQLGGPGPSRFLALNVGKFSLADFFDQNSYSHDPRSQFLNTFSPDCQFVLHPAYNRDRGPVNVLGARLHVAFCASSKLLDSC